MGDDRLNPLTINIQCNLQGTPGFATRITQIDVPDGADFVTSQEGISVKSVGTLDRGPSHEFKPQDF
jgi:hypothetical protein